jgi:hypothetical protein
MEYDAFRFAGTIVQSVLDVSAVPQVFLNTRNRSGQLPITACTTCCINNGIDTQISVCHTRDRKKQVLILDPFN